MDKKITLIKSICDALIKKDINSAGKILNDLKFKPPSLQTNRKNIPISLQLKVFHRDHYTCRYCGKPTIFIGILRLMSLEFPDDFPYHKNWKWKNTHPAYWELTTSCDHKIPVARGGDNNIENLVTACYKCNSMKTIWTLDELGWELKEIDNSEWDGLINNFIRLMEQKKIKDNSLRTYYNALIIAKMGNNR